MGSSDDTTTLSRTVRDLDARLGVDSAELTDEEVALLLKVAVRAAGTRLADAGELPQGDQASLPTATDVVHVCNWLLNAADLEPFELGFWRNFSGALRTNPGS